MRAGQVPVQRGQYGGLVPMTYEDAAQLARDWLERNGYEQWPDDVWHCGGYEADVLQVLSEFIQETAKP